MKPLILIVIITQINLFCSAQGGLDPGGKPPINHSVYDRWPEIRQEKISGDGSCAAYTVNSEKEGATLYIQSSDNSWTKRYEKAYNASFTDDSRYLVFNLSPDSIGILNTRKRLLQVFSGANYKLPEQGNTSWLACMDNVPVGILSLHELSSGKQQKIPGVTDYFFSPMGKYLLLHSCYQNGRDSFQLVLLMELKTGKIDTVLSGIDKTSNFAFDEVESQLAFIQEGKERKLMYYQKCMGRAQVLADQHTPGLQPGLSIAPTKVQFSQNGEKVFFGLQELSSAKDRPVSDTVGQVDVWSYFDSTLQSQQLKWISYGWEHYYRAVITKGTNKVIRLQQEADDWTTFEMADGGNVEYILTKTQDDWSQADWRPQSRPTIYLVSTLTGERKTVVEHGQFGIASKSYSPTGKYVIWFDKEQSSYFTYNTQTGTIKNISQRISVPLFNDEEDRPRKPQNFGIAGWTNEDKGVLIYDRYDIWLVDPDAIRTPVNITHGYGARTHTIFRYQPTLDKYWEQSIVINEKEPLLLLAFNRNNKDNGFYRLHWNSSKNPDLLTMGPYIYYYNFYPMPIFNMSPTILVKAKYANRYLLNRMNAREFPNLYTTVDFKELVKLTELAPQKDYNWMSAELMHWQTFDGKKAEGLLFKPENFDPGKKYPVIFYFYEKDAHGLHNYFRPAYSDGQLNIPYFVSNGYIVCDPNIYYTPGQTLESVFNSVVSAAHYLSTMPWVDSTKMGIQGHSFGGYEVNCLVGRTSLFKAAASAAGFCDLVSLYGNLRSDFGVTGSNWIEHGQTGLGVTLWEKPEAYMRNSPLFFADKVNTPLLIMHNEQDGASPFSQSVEFFSALRRLGKKAWMLQYDNSSHQVEGAANIRDYSIRLQQFFDHYLKGSPAPKWMVKGVPAVLKGRETGLAPAP